MKKETSIHWVGAGLSSGPGIVDLANYYSQIYVWDITTGNAKKLQDHIKSDARIIPGILDLDDEKSITGFSAALKPGDVVVSMLPAFLHVRLARLALAAEAHLVTSSYLSDEIRALDGAAWEKDVAVVTEVGLDPGIDHLFAHLLVDEAHKAGKLDKNHEIEFVSYCGGIPAEKTDFTYKFSWTPLGVLTALKNEAHLIEDHDIKSVTKAWEAVSELDIHGETFEVYPNRNSLPYVSEYGLNGGTNLKTFVRGTIRQAGWKKAWCDIFKQVETADMSALKALSDKLWHEHGYGLNEQDRVVLYVALTAHDEKGHKWSASLSLDEKGRGWQSAMASTVSLTVAQAVREVIAGGMKPGVQAAVLDPAIVRRWLEGLQENGLTVRGENITL